MRIALVAMMSFFCVGFLSTSLKADDKPADKSAAKTYTGVIIDEKCAEGKDQEKAGKHPKACCLKCAKDGAIGLMVDGKFHKFDANGTKLAKEYLDKKDSKTTATVTATEGSDGALNVTAVDAPAAAKPDAKS